MRSAGSDFARIDHNREVIAGATQQKERAAAETRTRRFDNAQSRADCDGCIEGVATGGKHFDARHTRERVGACDGRTRRRLLCRDRPCEQQ
jgi:hypothetical protein